MQPDYIAFVGRDVVLLELPIEAADGGVTLSPLRAGLDAKAEASILAEIERQDGWAMDGDPQ